MFSSAVIDEQGFAIVPGVLTESEVERILDDLQRTPLPASKAGIRHAMKHASVAALALDSRLLGIAKAVLGAEALPFCATLFDKSSDSNWLVVWHQDTALPLRQRREIPGWGPWSVKAGVTYAHAPASVLSRVLALRVHLDNCMAENGPLRVLSGTHLLGVLRDEEIECLARERAVTDCLATTGGVLVMRPLLVHSSSKVRAQGRRRVLHIEYATSVQVADGLELAVA